MSKISVIVPVYNVSEYIEQCIFSLTNQTLKDIEIIVVDDCGTDDSIKKVEKIAMNDKRIKIIYNAKNQGLAEARNIGLQYVSSEYVCFLDSDDWVATDFYEKLYDDIIKYKADIAVSDVLYYRKEEHSLTREWVSIWNFKSGKKIVSTSKDKQFNIYACACWNKLYKISLFKDYGLKYPKGLKIEDVPITTVTTILAKRIVLVKDAILYYRQRGDSIMAAGRKNRTPFDIFKIYEYTDKLLNEVKKITNKDYKQFHQIIDNFKIFNIYSWYSSTYSEYQPEFYDLMKNLFKTINIKNNPYINKDTKETYNLITSNHKMLEVTTCKLFNAFLLGRNIRFTDCIKVYLFKYILIDMIKLNNKNSCHYLFGFLPIFTIKRK